MGGLKDPPDPYTGTIPKQIPSNSKTPLNAKPGTSNGSTKEYTNITYNATDAAPYRIYVELKNKGDKDQKINKFSLGAYLRGMNEFKPFITDMKYLGQHKIMVFVSSYTKANLLVETVHTKSDTYKAYVPRHLVCISGMITGVPTDIDVNDIKGDIQCDVPIVDVVRMTKKEETTCGNQSIV